MTHLIDAAIERGISTGKWTGQYFNDDGDLVLTIGYQVDDIENGEAVVRELTKEVSPDTEDLEFFESRSIELKAISKADEYKHLRAKEYARLNQFELMYDDQKNDTTLWADAVNAIKLKYPKPS